MVPICRCEIIGVKLYILFRSHTSETRSRAVHVGHSGRATSKELILQYHMTVNEGDDCCKLRNQCYYRLGNRQWYVKSTKMLLIHVMNTMKFALVTTL